jgi:Repeat of unknown function (DUF5648)
MFRRRSTSMRLAVSLAVGAVVMVTGAAAASAVADPVTTISGQAVEAGSSNPATGLTVRARLAYGDYVVPAVTDAPTTTVGADGTYSLNFSYATSYYISIAPDSVYTTESGYSGTYARGSSSIIDAVPGVPLHCSIAAVPLSTWSKVGNYWQGEYSKLTCDPSPSLARVYRFWSPGFNNAHFFTTDALEAQNIRDNDKNWVDEGGAFTAVSANGDGSCATGLPVFRFYSQVFQSHFYTQSAAEKEHIVEADRNWTYEGVAYCAFPEARTGTVALYRFWSPVFGKHFFTADQAEADHIRTFDSNWTYENIAYYVAP